MAYAPHYRITIGGTLTDTGTNATNEIWACNVNAVPAGGGTINEDNYLSDIQDNLKTWYTAAASCMSNSSHLVYVKCNHVGVDGRYTDNTATHRYDYPVPVIGGAQVQDPQIISTATSWKTAKSRGPGSNGRVYLPNNTLGNVGSMSLAAGDQDKVVAAGVRLLQVLNNGNGGSGLPPQGSNNIVMIPVVSSNRDASNTDILEVRVGSVKDVQRRRKDQINEQYRVGLFLALSD